MLKLQLIDSGEFLVLGKDPVLTIDQHTTLFNQSDELLGSVAYEGELPLEPNRALLHNGHYLTTPNKLRRLPVRIWLGELPWKEVQFTWTLQNDTVNYTLMLDQGLVAAQLKNLKLNQLSGTSFADNLFSGSPAEMQAHMLVTAKAGPGVWPYVFFPWKNDGAYKEEAYKTDKVISADIHQPVNNYMNAWQVDSSGNGSFAVDLISPYSHTQIPAFYLTYVLRQIIAFLGYSPAGSWLDEPINQRIVLMSQCANVSSIIAGMPFYMPAVSLTDFLKEVRTRFGLLIDFDATRKICLVESIEVLRRTTDTLDLRLGQLTDLRETGILPAGYTLKQGTDDKDEAYKDEEKDSLPGLIIGDGTEEVELSSVQTRMLTEISPVSAGQANWKLPYMKQPIAATTPLDQASAQEYSDRNNFKLRFLYYYGMQPDAAGYLYPFASADNMDVSNQPVTNYTLALDGAAGATLALQQRYRYLYNSRPFEMDFRLPVETFLRITSAKRIIVRDRNGAAISCLLDQNSADLRDQPVLLARLTLYPEIWPANEVQQLSAVVPPVTPPVPPVDNGVVYLRLVLRNRRDNYYQYPPPGRTDTLQDIVVLAFADEAATQPKQVINLPVRLQTTTSYNPPPQSNSAQATYTVSGSDAVLISGAGQSTRYNNGETVNYAYALLPSANYHILP